MISLAGPVSWHPGLAGDYPGLESFIELGRSKVRMTFCWCPPARTPPEAGEPAAQSLAHGFWMAKHPVSQAQWEAVMGDNPSRKNLGPNFPVDSVSWNMAKGFCGKAGLRLPWEAEWEHACRAGTTTDFAVGTGRAINSQLANFDGNRPDGEGPEAFKWQFREATTAQGSFPPNAWGLHDMHGQLWEWCEDGLEHTDGGRVLRGGSWIRQGSNARSAVRSGRSPGFALDDFGFRPCPSSTSIQH